MPDYDFRVPGVTSMSIDPHKYGYAPLGSSIVLFRNAEIRKHELFTCTGWPGYTLVNPTIQSSKSGGPLAGAAFDPSALRLGRASPEGRHARLA